MSFRSLPLLLLITWTQGAVGQAPPGSGGETRPPDGSSPAVPPSALAPPAEASPPPPPPPPPSPEPPTTVSPGAPPPPAPPVPSAPPSAAFDSSPSSDAWTQTPLPPAAAVEPAPPAASSTEPATAVPYASSGSFDEAAEPRKKDPSHGLFGPLRLGPVVGVGVPSLFSLGGMLKITRYFGAGINVGIIPEVRLSYYGDATLSYQEYDVYGRIHPFGGGFFLGAGVGYARAKGTLDQRFDTSEYAAQFPSLPASVSSHSEGSVQTLVVIPQLGFFQTFASGFSVGVDAGIQLPVAPSEIEFDTRVSEGIPAPLLDEYLEPNRDRVRDTLETIGRTPLPTLNLRIGWLL